MSTKIEVFAVMVRYDGRMFPVCEKYSGAAALREFTTYEQADAYAKSLQKAYKVITMELCAE